MDVHTAYVSTPHPPPHPPLPTTRIPTTPIPTPHTGSPEYRYVIAPQQVQAGHTIQSGPDAPVAAGNTLPLMNIPIGLAIHNIEKHPGKGGQLVRAAGTSATVMARGVCVVW